MSYIKWWRIKEDAKAALVLLAILSGFAFVIIEFAGVTNIVPEWLWGLLGGIYLGKAAAKRYVEL